jgi:hypothetical protein
MQGQIWALIDRRNDALQRTARAQLFGYSITVRRSIHPSSCSQRTVARSQQ